MSAHDPANTFGRIALVLLSFAAVAVAATHASAQLPGRAGGGTANPGCPSGGGIDQGNNNPYSPGDVLSNSGASNSRAARTSASTSGGNAAGARPSRSSVRGTSGRGTGRSGGGTTSVFTDSGPVGWTAWWAHNRDAYLWDALPTAESVGPLTAAGGGARNTGARSEASYAPTRAQVATRIIPALIERVTYEQDSEVLAQAALALGRVALPAPLDQPVAEALVPLLAHDDLRVAQSAAVAIGLLRTDAARDTLLELATCSQRGHALVADSSVPDSLRVMAALAIGLTGDPASAPRLMDLAEGGLDATDALRAGAILSLGLVTDGVPDTTEPWLAEWSHDRRLPLPLQVSVATSVARRSHSGATETLLAILDDRDADAPTQQAAVAGLARTAALAQVEAVDALTRTYERDRDAGTRQLALLTLARLGGGAAVSPDELEAQGEIEKLLSKELRKPSHSQDRPFVALATGLLLRERPDLRRDWGPLLLEAYEETSEQSWRGAFALGLGLGGVTDAGVVLLADFQTEADAELTGHLAMSLALLRDPEAAAWIRGWLIADAQPQPLRAELATALLVMDDEEAVGFARKAHAEASTWEARMGLTRALGNLRHAGALIALLDTSADAELDTSTRAAACAALGRLAERTEQPYTARLTVDGAPEHASDAVVALLATR
jgi:hypothetical protein